MHFVIPKWVRHGGKHPTNSIYSLDIQPNGPRLATAGQDRAVRLWSLPIIAQSSKVAPAPQTVDLTNNSNTNSKKPLPSMTKSLQGPLSQKNSETQFDPPPSGGALAVLEAHAGAVNCVRWAPSGDRLASGGDDHLVLVYEKEPTQQVTAFNSAAGTLESWRHWRPFRGHVADVTDVCWSPCGEKLASASIDNIVIIWNVRSVSPVARLEGHSGLVKGVAWDPVGKFIASQSDDRTVRIWRTSDWKVEKVISEPFAAAIFEQNAQLFFLRLAWSPCGSQLVGVNAHKRDDMAPMFSRESGFTEQVEFMGHKEPITCSRFSPRLYRPHGNKDKYTKPYTVLLLGSKDMGATCWKAEQVIPFFHMEHMFKAEVLDLSWSHDGYTAAACSTDGQVMYMRFKPDGLGDVVPLDEMNTILKNTWRLFGGTHANGSAPPEYPAQLEALRKKNAANGSGNANGSGSSDVELGDVTPTPETPAPTTNPMDINIIGQAPARVESKKADPRVLAVQKEKRVGGKRRIIPMSMIQNGANAAPDTVVQVQPMAPSKRPRVEAVGANAVPSAAFAAAGTTRNAVHERRLTRNHNNHTTVYPPGAKEIPLAHATPLCAPSIVGLNLMLLPGPNESVGRCRFISSETPPTLVEAKEETSAAGGYSVAVSKGGKCIWKDYHGKKSPSIVSLAGIQGKFVAAAAEDGTLYLYSATSGRRILPPTILDSAPHIMEAHVVKTGSKKDSVANGTTGTRNNKDEEERWFLLVVSRAALCSVFDVRAKKLVCARSAAPLLARAEGDSAQAKLWRSIIMARVTVFGEPILSLSDKQSFAYSRKMAVWTRVADNNCANTNSEFARGLPLSHRNRKMGVLRQLQAGTTTKNGNGGNMGSLVGMSDITRAATESLAHLETLLESAVVLDAADDYRYYLAIYISRIAAAVKDDVVNCEERLREVCDTLLNMKRPNEDIKVLGFSGRELLKETVLPIVTASRELQRVAEEYSECLAEIERRNNNDIDEDNDNNTDNLNSINRNNNNNNYNNSIVNKDSGTPMTL